jgi:hypothetical protein
MVDVPTTTNQFIRHILPPRFMACRLVALLYLYKAGRPDGADMEAFAALDTPK